MAPLGLGCAGAGAAGCGFPCVAGEPRAGEHGAAPRRPAHHATRSGALSLVFPRWQPRGIYVAGPKQDNSDIYVQQIGAGSPLRVTTDSSEDFSPVWSPDGRWIAFLRRRWDVGTSE